MRGELPISMNSGMYSSNSPEWETPQWLFDELNKEFSFSLDPAATDENHKCEHYFTEAMNGLDQVWSGVIFCNPPYGREIGKWVEKGFRSVIEGGGNRSYVASC